jgi:hypothetical protein
MSAADSNLGVKSSTFGVQSSGAVPATAPVASIRTAENNRPPSRVKRSTPNAQRLTLNAQ